MKTGQRHSAHVITERIPRRKYKGADAQRADCGGAPHEGTTSNRADERDPYGGHGNRVGADCDGRKLWASEGSAPRSHPRSSGLADHQVRTRSRSNSSAQPRRSRAALPTPSRSSNSGNRVGAGQRRLIKVAFERRVHECECRAVPNARRRKFPRRAERPGSRASKKAGRGRLAHARGSGARTQDFRARHTAAQWGVGRPKCRLRDEFSWRRDVPNFDHGRPVIYGTAGTRSIAASLRSCASGRGPDESAPKRCCSVRARLGTAYRRLVVRTMGHTK